MIPHLTGNFKETLGIEKPFSLYLSLYFIFHNIYTLLTISIIFSNILSGHFGTLFPVIFFTISQ